jgi:pilus assembly protein Flp/PilA
MTKSALRAFWCEEQGQDLVEYALLLAFLALAAITTLTTIGTNINTLFTDIGTALGNADAAVQAGGG